MKDKVSAHFARNDGGLGDSLNWRSWCAKRSSRFVSQRLGFSGVGSLGLGVAGWRIWAG